jgi:hypothetical protein
VRQRAAAEDGLEVHPLALDGVELREDVVEQAQLRLVLRDGVGEGAEEGRVLERAEQRLEVGDGRRHVLPVLDERRVPPVLRVLRERERGVLRPRGHLLDGLADGDLARRARGERAQLVLARDDRGRGGEEVVQAQLLEGHALHPKLGEERAPVLGLEGVAAHVLEARRDVAVARELRAQVVGDGAGRARRRLLHPRGDDVVEGPQPLAEGDPVLLAQLVELAREGLVERARGDVRLDVGAHVVEAAEGRRLDAEVVAVGDDLARLGLELGQLGLPLLDARDDAVHLLAHARLELLRLELEPARAELLELAHELADAAGHLAAQVLDLVLDPLVERAERQLELVPLGHERPLRNEGSISAP